MAHDTLGATLRTWRDRLSPADAGLRVASKRRTPGLRREELANLAGLSVDYVVRLEQGRATTPSAQVLAALARALQLDSCERDHLYLLAGLQPPAAGLVSDHVPPGVQRILTRLGEIPLGVFAADWRLIRWSPLWAALVGDPESVAPADRNLVRARFGLATETVLSRWPVLSELGPEVLDTAVVSDLRSAEARYPDDPRVTDLIAEAQAGSERFARLWASGAVGVHIADRKTIAHPVVGPVRVDCDVLTVPCADLRIVTYTAPAGSEDAEKLDFLRVTAPLAAG
ncbi:helix-turn-helix domain-containing protein [Cryptosporangium aurantiacum]|uniref:Helix-turn-helix domain-containing protein n=1 Tax=Cryptosporangium aurantiacum TaxID=134849 RepID=A0A1M7PA43_9ACTN|nr:helix-turn-helix transcriptional regulator [Cryptosporangium aurantiacum]SHN13123.1 Helix-turn-helix domain-containing protein [Cryptosporangium aurantiacum]